MHPVSPPLCRMTGASTCTPLTTPVRWMRNLTVTRPGTKVYSSGRARVTQASTASSFESEPSVNLVLRQLVPAFLREIEAYGLGPRRIFPLPHHLEVSGTELDRFGLDRLTSPAARGRRGGREGAEHLRGRGLGDRGAALGEGSGLFGWR